MSDEAYLFVSYSRKDAEKVDAFISGLADGGVKVRGDRDLRPGEDWASALGSSLQNAAGLLIFVSHTSVQSRWVHAELNAAANEPGRLIIPVILEHVDTLPEAISKRLWIDVSMLSALADIRRVALSQAPQINAALQDLNRPKLTPEQSSLGAREIVSELKRRPADPASDVSAPKSVFIIHGHDDDTLTIVVEFLKSLEVKPVVLRDIGGPDQSLWQKFKRWSKDIKYAIAILSPDDLGAAKREYKSDYEGQKVGAKALQYRARQNVILELGYFYGYLDWDQVFVLFKPGANPYPRFERPSDLEGIVFDVIDEKGNWKNTLKEQLLKAGFDVQPKLGQENPRA